MNQVFVGDVEQPGRRGGKVQIALGILARVAAEAGVEFFAYSTRLDREEVRIDGQLPVVLRLGPRLEGGRVP